MNLNRDAIRKLQGLILFTVVVVVAGVNYRRLFDLLGWLLHIASPFILGGVIAFILNVPMRRIEKMLPVPKKHKKLLRPVSLVFSILLVAGILFLVFFVVAPQVFQTLWSLQKSVPVFFAGLQRGAEQLFASYPEILEYVSGISVNWDQILADVAAFLKNGAGTMLNTTFSAAVSIATGVTNFSISFIFSIYILLQKETLKRQMGMLLEAFLPETLVEEIFYIARLSEKTFSSFLTGQCLEAVILGTMFFIVLSLLSLPYALLIGVLIAFTALIPIFGAFIGLGVGTFLMLMVSPTSALIFVVTFFILQQIEGNLIYPHVVGNSVGLPSIWVLAAVTIGGSMMGVAGMLVFIPLCSVLYSLLRGAVYNRLEKKGDHAQPEAEQKNPSEE